MTRIPTRIHAIVDYIAGIALILSPWLFGFSESTVGTLVSVLGGAAVIVLASTTMNEFGIWRVLPVTSHLPLEALIGLALVTSPFVLGFSSDAWAPLVVVGLVLLVSDLFTERVAGGGVKQFVQAAHRERDTPGTARQQFTRLSRERERQRMARHS